MDFSHVLFRPGAGGFGRNILHQYVVSLYLDERRGVQGNTSMRSRKFPRAQPEGTPKTKCWYFLYSLTQVKVHYPIYKSDEAVAIAIAIAIATAIAIAMSRAIAMYKPRAKKETD